MGKDEEPSLGESYSLMEISAWTYGYANTSFHMT